jgi:sterol desaturase/sphingolipid hydroxylase (fatty acid hydroxylase superfamily)
MTGLSGSTEMFLRLGFFLAMFVAMAGLEALYPRRQRLYSRLLRWSGNLGISVINQVFVRLLIPATAVALAAHAGGQGWGLLNQVALPVWVAIPVAVLVLDLAIYLQHIVYHVVPVLWRFHRMHHADLDFDVTTGIRFHPLSILLSALIKLAIVLAIGPPVIAVLIFEVLLNATSMFNHSNLKIPKSVDRLLRKLVVTPDMHRVHHSTDGAEMNRNFGFNFPWWDRLFGTYLDQPALGHDNMIVGLEQFRARGDLGLGRMLIQPFVGDSTGDPDPTENR